MEKEKMTQSAATEDTLVKSKSINYERLSEPFTNNWKVQSFNRTKTKCYVIPYIDARQVQERLDEVFGVDGWSNTYEADTGTSSISVFTENGIITKSDVGYESDNSRIQKSTKYKGKASDAFKRAAVLWGIGRYLYNIGTQVLDYSDSYKKPVTPDGTILYTPEQLSLYMNKMSSSEGYLVKLWKENVSLQSNAEFVNALKTIKTLL